MTREQRIAYRNADIDRKDAKKKARENKAGFEAKTKRKLFGPGSEKYQ